MSQHTVSILEALFDERIVDICENLGVFQFLPHTPESSLLLQNFRVCSGCGLHQGIDSLAIRLDDFQFLGAVLLQEFASFLEALVGELCKGNVGATGKCSSSSSGSHGHLPLFAL